MASPQLGNGFVSIANELWDEIISRDFSKRQKEILLLILRLSYGCRKKHAHIPKLKYFSLCGVGPTHISKELKLLQTYKVITWERENMNFALNKDYDVWQVAAVKDWNPVDFNELLHLNLTEKNLPKREVTKTGSYQKGNKKLTKKVSIKLPKREVRHVPMPWRSKVDRMSKDSIKDSIKDNCCCLGENNQFNDLQKYRKEVETKYIQRRGVGLELTISDESMIEEFFTEKVPLQIVLDGIDKAFNNYKPRNSRDKINSLKYCSQIVFSLQAQQKDAPVNESDFIEEIAASTEEQQSDEEVLRLLEELKAKRGGSE
ncbi:hypothetical protein BVG16_13645 [Paenibacillus selenitireducens]|uniref:Bacteriophage lambda Replication protein O N-terminal domain-containing protein n=1 Tax=Paenibacillus selenitireducens TaxID=1324314 RepID=A0A1T2XCZ9_9BACL|nr:replication protein [Paenibacillus selenitireducens]OPA77493.1 hypothetical protein BVG16_13645 [Paenibacillus selenitireducens]